MDFPVKLVTFHLADQPLVDELTSLVFKCWDGNSEAAEDIYLSLTDSEKALLNNIVGEYRPRE